MNFKKTLLTYGVIIFLTSVAAYFNIVGSGILFLPLFFLIIDLVLGAISIEKNFYIQSVNTLPSHCKRGICLTFDDGIHPELTPQVLDILKEKNVQAIFFIIGKNIAGNEDVIRRMHAEGHQIGNHSFTHSAWFDLKSSKAMLQEIEQTTQALEAIIDEKITYFRPPYGVTNPNLASAIKKSGLQSVGWSLRSMDTVAKSKDKLFNKLMLNTKEFDIVLLHDRCQVTIDVLTQYIDFCLSRNFKFVTLKTENEESI